MRLLLVLLLDLVILTLCACQETETSDEGSGNVTGVPGSLGHVDVSDDEASQERLLIK